MNDDGRAGRQRSDGLFVFPERMRSNLSRLAAAAKSCFMVSGRSDSLLLRMAITPSGTESPPSSDIRQIELNAELAAEVSAFTVDAGKTMVEHRDEKLAFAAECPVYAGAIYADGDQVFYGRRLIALTPE